MPSQKECTSVSGFSPEMKRQFRSMALALVVSLVCTAVSVVTWFREDLTAELSTDPIPYKVFMDIVKDPGELHGGENLLASCHNAVYSDQTFVVGQGVTSGTANITNVSNGKIAFHYLLRVTCFENGKERPIFQARDAAPVTPRSQSVSHTIPLTPGTTVRVQFYTAPRGMSIHLASNVGQLTRPYQGNTHWVYLTEDVATEDAVTFAQGYPNIHLAGHTLTAKSLQVKTKAGDFGKMVIEGGSLVLNGKTMTEQDAVAVTGEGKVTVHLQDLM